MPTEPTLSERLLEYAEHIHHYEYGVGDTIRAHEVKEQREADLREAARLCARFEQPQSIWPSSDYLRGEAEGVPELRHCDPEKLRTNLIHELNSHANTVEHLHNALVELAEARAERDLSEDAHGAVRALHPDLMRCAFIDDAVALVLQEREEARTQLAEARDAARSLRTERCPCARCEAHRYVAAQSAMMDRKLGAALSGVSGESEVPA